MLTGNLQRPVVVDTLTRCKSRSMRLSARRPWPNAGSTPRMYFADAAFVFAGVTLEVEDKRKNYGEARVICYGLLGGRMAVVGYTPRGADRHVFSMRKANEREQERIAPLLEV